MNPKLLMCLFLGIKSAFLLPLVSHAAVTAPTSNLLNRQSSVEMEVVDLNQSASQSILIADRNNDNKRNNDNRRNNDNQRDSGRQFIRIQRPVHFQTPIRVRRPIQTRYPIHNSGGIRVRIGF